MGHGPRGSHRSSRRRQCSEETPCPRITELASGAITAADTIAIELVETDGQPTVMIIRWPADAHTVLAAIKAGRRL